MTMSAAPIATGASGPAPGAMDVAPTVKTRKNVPMNSTRYFFIRWGGVGAHSTGRGGANERFFGVAGGADSGVVAHSDANTDPRGRLQRLHLRPGRNAGRHDAAALPGLGGGAAQRGAQGPPRRELLLRARRGALQAGG